MKIPKRIAKALINSLKGGVVTRVGLPYVTVGRKDEIDALLRDVDIIADGGASFRFIVGKYGSGKSFLLQTIRNYVMAKNFVVVDADLSPERRLQGTRGQGLATYKELIRNILPEIRKEQILCEPIGRNTAPAIAYAAYWLRKHDPEAQMIVTPADHWVVDEEGFRSIIGECLDFVTGHDALMTVGIRPTRPETGYGYIQASADETICPVKSFTE